MRTRTGTFLILLAMLAALPLGQASAGVSYQADMFVRGDVGEGVHNDTGAGQTKNVSIRRGDTKTLPFWNRNDGLVTDTFTYWGCNLGGDVRVTWLDFNNNDITEQVVGGTYSTAAMDSGVSEVPAKLRIKVKRSARDGERFSCGLSAQSWGSGGMDVAIYRVRAT